MLDVKAQAELRGKIYERLVEMELEDGNVIGMTKEGLAIQSGGATIVIKVTVKKEGFDALQAHEEYLAAEQAKIEKAAAKTK